MSEERLIRQCAPTLAGIKTGSLFPCPYETREELMADVRAFNRRFAARGLCLLPMRLENGHALLYLYRPAKLRRDLQNGLAQEILSLAGYRCGSCECCVTGLFLSYPPEDVRGFIENRAQNFKRAGLWKVYGDEARAEALFRKFKKCTQIYCERWQSGSNMDELAVAV